MASSASSVSLEGPLSFIQRHTSIASDAKHNNISFSERYDFDKAKVRPILSEPWQFGVMVCIVRST